MFADPHVKAINLVKEIDHPTCGKIKVVDSPVKFSDFQNDLKPSPILGQHTDETLKDLLDLSDEKIAELRSNKTIT